MTTESIHAVAHDVRHALRSMRRGPAFTAITILTLALGIGATTAIFSIVNGVLIQPLRFPQPESLLWVSHTAVFRGVRIDTFSFNSQMAVAYLDHNRTFQEFGVWTTVSANVTGTGEPEKVQTLVATQGVLPALGVPPALGRLFSLADDSPTSAETAILTHGFWQRQFGGDPNAIGRVVTIDSRPREVIGVMPKDFNFLDVAPDVILPRRFDRSRLTLGGFGNRGIARLKPGVTLAQANADVARLLRIWLDSLGPDRAAMEGLQIGPAARPLKQYVVGDVGRVLWVLMGTIGMVLLIACANVANLLLVRTEGRQRELAIRAALGAGWARIARGLLVESLTLGLAGGVVGVGLAAAALRLLTILEPANLPRLTEISIDPQVLAFALGVSLLSGLLFGIVPVLKHAGPRIAAVLHSAGRSGSQSREQHRSQSTLVVVQVALALVLLVGSGLMIRSFQAMRSVEPGFARPEQVQTARIAIPETEVAEPARVLQLQHEMVDRLAAISGVRSVAFMTALPMETEPEFESGTAIVVEGAAYEPGAVPFRRIKWVSPGSFETVQTRLLVGRDFTWTDLHEARNVAVVSENMARESWGSAPAALGRRIREGGAADPWREVIGVVGNVYDDGAHQPPPAIVYWPAQRQGDSSAQTQGSSGGLSASRSVAFAVRSDRAGSESLISDIENAIWGINANLPLARVQTLDAFYDRSMARTSFTLVMLGIAGIMALLLGIIGIYGVLAYTVARRRPEIGLRMALGAQRGMVVRMFIRQALLLSGIGIALGLVAAAALSRLMASLLFGVTPQDPITYAATASVLLAAAIVASYVPASRAATVNPTEAFKG